MSDGAASIESGAQIWPDDPNDLVWVLGTTGQGRDAGEEEPGIDPD